MGREGNNYVANNVIDSNKGPMATLGLESILQHNFFGLCSGTLLYPQKYVIEKYLLKVTLLSFNIVGGILFKCFETEWMAHCIEA